MGRLRRWTRPSHVPNTGREAAIFIEIVANTGESVTMHPSWVEIVQDNNAKYGDLVVGIDPSLADVPSFFAQGDGGSWIGRFVDFVLDAIDGRVGFVKFQSAYYEACGLAGLTAL